MTTQSQDSNRNSKAKAWLEAVRLRTLPASLAGVIAGCGCAALFGSFSWPQALICFLFALIAQIASNFANEYYDFKNGLDKKGREGFRRGVTEGDIAPEAMRNATFLLLVLDAVLGCSLIVWGGWWLVPVGVAIALFALGYSTGPYPLSHHGLGDIAVVIFFGIVPVCLTAYVQVPQPEVMLKSLPVAVAIGLQCANILIVNNYRDMEDDKDAAKNTTVVIFGRKVMSAVYLANGVIAVFVLLIFIALQMNPLWILAGACFLLPLHIKLWKNLRNKRGKELNPVLGKTAMLLLLESIWITAAMFCS